MVKISAITMGISVPSSRFRVRQYIPLLRKNNKIILKEHVQLFSSINQKKIFKKRISKNSNRLIFQTIKIIGRFPGVIDSYYSHATFIQKLCIPNLVKISKKPVLFDLDDAIWLYSDKARRDLIRIIRNVNLIVVGNNNLADWVSNYTKYFRIVPTAVDPYRFHVKQYFGDKEHFVIGWTGTKVNLKYLYRIEKIISCFMNDFSDTRLHVICDEQPKFKFIKIDHVKYVKWSEVNEVKGLQEFDVGIMPLDDDEWTRNKCSFKMLQYMATGIPVVVTPVGMNKDILLSDEIGYGTRRIEDWYEALKHLKENISWRLKLGLNGRKLVEKYYSTKIIANKLSTVFKEYV
ncbi:MAG: glycosyltransferase [Eubacteriaceae bacterium]